MKQCSVLYCRSDTKLHRFPTDIYLRKQWTLFCGKKSIWVPTSESRMCQLHFSLCDIKRNGRLKDEAVPHIRGIHFFKCFVWRGQSGKIVFFHELNPPWLTGLKGECHQIFDSNFFYEINTPDKQTKVFLTFDSISPISPYRDSVTRFFIICFA